MKQCLACHTRFDQVAWNCPKCGHTPVERGGFLAFSPKLAAQSDGFDPELFSRYAQLEADNFWFVSRNALLSEVLKKRVPDPLDVLEIGCGTGFVLSALRRIYPTARLSGSDIFTEGLGFAAQRVLSAKLFQMDATAIPFAQEFDLVGAFDVLEHIDDDNLALQQIHGALKPGGSTILTVPQHPSMWSRMDEYAHHKRRYTRAELLEKMRAVGFEVDYVTSFVSLLLPAMWASRIQQRNAPPVEDGVDPALRIHPVLNKVFNGVMAVERALIRKGMTFPAGGSLLVIGRKAA